MKKSVTSVASLAVLAMLLPAAAPDEPMVECDTETEVIAEGESATYDGLAPVVVDPSGEGSVGGANLAELATVAGTAGETAIKVSVTGTMTWDVPGDYELRAYNADGEEIGNSTAFNPTDGNTESVTVSMDLCEDVTFMIDNYLGTPGGPVSLEVSVEGKRPRVRK